MHLPKFVMRLFTKVAIVEDDATDADFIQRSLDELGYKSTVYRDAEQFMEDSTPGRFSHVFIDLGLPRMTGVQLITVLRNSFHKLRIVAVTGSTDITAIPRDCLIIRKTANMRLAFRDLLT